MKIRIVYLLITLICYLICNDLHSQNQISGTVSDSLYRNPVEYASVSLYRENTKELLSGQLTDSTGRFNFKDLKPGEYYLKLEFIGYKTKEIRNISLNKSKDVNLGSIALSLSEQALNEILIKGQKAGQSISFEKQTYKADQYQSAKGGTAIDVLKNMPSVSVNAEGEVRLRGSTGFLVLVNGKPVASDITTVLSQIPANIIENIEVITSPSAKYDADGKSGIINITTKKGSQDGINLIANLQGGFPSVDHYDNKGRPLRYGADASLNYHKGKWDIILGGSYQENDLAGWRSGDVNTTISNIYTSFPSSGERSFKRRNYAVRSTVTFNLDKNNSFSAGVYHGQRRQFRRADINYDNTKSFVNNGEQIENFAYYNSNLVKKQGDFSLINLDYNHTFKDSSKLTLSGLYETALLEGYTKNLNSDLVNHTDTIDYVLNTGKSPLKGYRGKLDYTTKIGKGRLESGYQFRYQKQDGVYQYLNSVLGTGLYTLVPEFSADITIQNIIHGIYTQYTGKIAQLEYQAGLRYEYSQRTFKADQNPESYHLNLSNIFPSANLSYAINKKLRLKGGFSSRVQRSTSNELNPYPEREHSETLEQGDPHIKPEFVYISEIGLIHELPGTSVFVNVYNQQIKNVVNRVNSVYNDTIINRIYTNAGKAEVWGVESGLNFKPLKWWTLYTGGNFYNYRIKGTLFNNSEIVSNSAFAYSFNVNNTFSVTKTFSVQASLNYLSQRPTAQGKDSRFITPNLSLKRSFLDGRLSAVFQWQYIGLGFIKSNEQRITTWGNNFYTTTNYIQEKDIFLLNLNFNLNKLDKKLRLPSSEFGEREF